MGRIRTVKPELFKHEELFDLERATGLPIRAGFIGLFTCCDREGRFKWRPRALKLDALPYDDLDFSRVLDALWSRDFVRKYAIESEIYGVIPTWDKHQVINNRESPSDIPAPTESSYVSMTSTREARVDDATGTPLVQVQGEGKGKEGKGIGKEGEGDMSEQSPDALIPAEKIERRKTRRYTPEDEACARWLFGCNLSVNAEAKEPNWNTWADDVRLMREQDKRTHRAICELYGWAKKDTFWSPNIQCPSKLREKWDQLTEKRMAAGKPNGKPGAESIEARNARIRAEVLGTAAPIPDDGMTLEMEATDEPT